MDIEKIINDNKIFKINRLDPFADFINYKSKNDLAKDNQSMYHSLNGEWYFHWSKNIGEKPSNFYRSDFNHREWSRIKVPSHIELNGYDQIHYCNTQYPWDGKVNIRPPYVDDEYNPVGSYVIEFDLPIDFIDKRVYISFKGVEQGFSLYLNDEFIGYSEDTFTSSDFDLTNFIKVTQNKLSVEVYKKTSGSWLEDQDFFRFSGIFRDVMLYYKDDSSIDDIWIQSEVINELKDSNVKVNLKMTNHSFVKLTIGSKGKTIFEDLLNFKIEENTNTYEAANNNKYFTCVLPTLTDIELWDINKPNLYDFTFELLDKDHNLITITNIRHGFRKFEIINKVMYLNNKRLIINGVNRHEWNPNYGRAITKENMHEDLKSLLENNITAVRTSHYPNNSYWYHLCDEHGIIVMDETNIESHGSWQKMGKISPEWNVPGNDDSWLNCVIDRGNSMFERDKNHSCILWWSLGNESYAGTVLVSLANFFRSKDSSRLIHYEGCVYTPQYADCTDVFSRMYPAPEFIEQELNEGIDKPYILCEFMHNMGNSLGGFESYVRLTEKFDQYQGGFIWDFKDQALYAEINGVKQLIYGGDFNDRPSDYNFSGNGLLTADGKCKPAMQEVKYWFMNSVQRHEHDRRNNEYITNYASPLKIINNHEFNIIDGDVNLGVKGKNFHYIFSHQDGGIVSLVIDNKEWVYRPFKPVYWRAITENDKANRFIIESNAWSSATKYGKHTNKIINKQKDYVEVTYEFFGLIENQSSITYTIYKDGTIKVNCQFNGNDNLPNLACFGTRLFMTDKFDKFEYVGYSGETYPDRFKGGIYGNYEKKIAVANYLVPQENGLNYAAKQFTLTKDKNSLNFYALSNFHFSILNNTLEDFENAYHSYELAPETRTIISIYSNMRGVGGIDTWGADVEEQYHVKANKQYNLEFFIKAN